MIFHKIASSKVTIIGNLAETFKILIVAYQNDYARKKKSHHQVDHRSIVPLNTRDFERSGQADSLFLAVRSF